MYKRQFPNDYRGYNNLGKLAYQAGNIDKAESYFKKAASVNATPEVNMNDPFFIFYRYLYFECQPDCASVCRIRKIAQSGWRMETLDCKKRNIMSQRKFSIITINYNNKEGLRKTIESVVCLLYTSW